MRAKLLAPAESLSLQPRIFSLPSGINIQFELYLLPVFRSYHITLNKDYFLSWKSTLISWKSRGGETSYELEASYELEVSNYELEVSSDEFEVLTDELEV